MRLCIHREDLTRQLRHAHQAETPRRQPSRLFELMQPETRTGTTAVSFLLRRLTAWLVAATVANAVLQEEVGEGNEPQTAVLEAANLSRVDRMLSPGWWQWILTSGMRTTRVGYALSAHSRTSSPSRTRFRGSTSASVQKMPIAFFPAPSRAPSSAGSKAAIGAQQALSGEHGRRFESCGGARPPASGCASAGSPS